MRPHKRRKFISLDELLEDMDIQLNHVIGMMSTIEYARLYEQVVGDDELLREYKRKHDISDIRHKNFYHR